MNQNKPIFYDEKRRRWFFTRRVLEISGVLFTLLLVTFFLSILNKVALPSLLLPSTTPIRRPVLERITAKKPVGRQGRQHRVATLGTVPPKYDPLRAAFYVAWDPNSLATLKKHDKDIDLLIAEELHSVVADGSLTVVDGDNHLHTNVDADEAVRIMSSDKMHLWMQSMRSAQGSNFDLGVMGLINNSDATTFQTRELAPMLANPAARKRLETDMLRYTQQSHQVGICVDFEDVPEKSQENFRAFAAETAALFHAANLKLTIALPAADPVYDYGFFGKQVDAIILMDYDQHWLTSAPGPIAAQDWFVRNLRTALKSVPPQKIIMGIANYGYDWPDKPNASDLPQTVSFQGAVLTAHESDAQIEFDADSLNPHYSYYDEHNHVHRVWMLDAVTAYNELRAAERAGVQGTAVWRLGDTDPSMWRIWNTLHPDDAARQKIDDLAPGPDLTLEGPPNGDIWRILDTPQRGVRSFRYDAATDTITDETYTKYPLSWDIEIMGDAPHKIAITFDDGPDPKWTPKILDILKQKKAPATFFVIGENANRFPQILKREYNDGDEIGNHTYTHQHFDENSPQGLIRVELNVTERLIESTLGVKTLLFRPPYGIDHQPETADEVSMLPVPQDMGYMLVGARIDPHDWGEPGGIAPPQAATIVKNVLDDADKGHIIMLHDGGGDRSHTVEALPRIIDSLRSAGYQLVPVSELVNQTEAQVMPKISGRERWAARADGFIFSLYFIFRFGIATVFILGILLISGRAFIIGILALIEKLRSKPASHPEFAPPVSILIPAYNEEDVIVQTVTSALASDYSAMEIIVVNDGSFDRTSDLLEQYFGENPKVRILHQQNRGKSAALSRALAEVTSPIVVTIDADTSIQPDAVRQLVRDFSDPRVGAVAGNVKVGNRTRWLTRWQALEYITSQNLEKRAFDLLNCIPVVPGAVGAWRVEAIRAAGGFSNETVAEDTDLTIAIRRAGWRITYDEEAIGYTQAPETADALIKQRFRWTFGTLQSVWKHRDTLGRKRYGTLGWIALPNVFLFQFLLPLFSPAIDLLFMISVVLWGLGQIRGTQLPILWTAQDVERSLVFFIGFMLIDLLTCVIAFALEKHEDWSLLLPLVLQRFYYRQMMYIVLFRALTQAVKGRPVGWRGVEPETPAPRRHRESPAETIPSHTGD